RVSTTNAMAAGTATIATSASTPQKRLVVSSWDAWLSVRSRQDISLPIQVTGWPMARKSQSGYPAMRSASSEMKAIRTDMDIPGEVLAAVDHGGSLGRARALFPQAPEPFVDLSTGINPHSYPLFDLPATA